MADWLLYALCGGAGGVLTGLGLGGGAVLVLLLNSLCGAGQLEAQSAAAVCYIVSGAFALPTHIKSKSVDKKTALTLIIWGVPAAVAGALLAFALPREHLRRLFGAAALVLAFLPQKKGLNASEQKSEAKKDEK